MNDKKLQNDRRHGIYHLAVTAGLCAVMMLTASQALGATEKVVKKGKKPVASSTMAFAPQVSVALNKSTLIKLPAPASRISVGNPDVADVILLGAKEIYLLGKKVGTTNVIVWGKNGRSTVIDVSVGMDFSGLQAKLRQLIPGGKDIKVGIANDSLVLTGMVADATKVNKAIILAEAYAGKKIVNMMQVQEPQQVMLEVKVAEVSKTLLDSLGVNLTGVLGRATFNSLFTNTGIAYNATGEIIAGRRNTSNLSITGGSHNGMELNAKHNNDLVKILAEPTIMALSGQEGAFLAGGKIYIPVPQGGTSGTTFTLEEKEFGVGLKFTPTVLEGGLINLRVTPEVSELASTGGSETSSVPGFSSSTITLLPTITTRRASTTVQLYDGQSFAIGGLIKSKTTESMKTLPGLGQIPILGALFRSSEFQNERTELLFVITPRLVKPLRPNYALPTDNLIEPNTAEFLLEGKMEGTPPISPEPADKPRPVSLAPAPSPQSNASGFQMK